GHGVDDEQRLMHVHGFANPAQLLEERFIDLQPSGRVDHHDVAVEPARLVEAAFAELWHSPLAVGRNDGGVDVATELFELLDGGRPAYVGGHQERPVAVTAHRHRQL